ncbi:hypothetical protein D0809_16155 [Flavobacterium circumlabens]|uniref:Uncharacterized protein n=1 Tax=Flavobacterium circumlabens TaxID=2133765 RepID=A0A4Y7U957_9FLAO|nr:hypothetical protein D0809_16155 [Flavobacterium circumlabens]
MLFYFSVILKKENKSKNQQTYLFNRVYEKKTPIVLNWRLLAVVISAGQILNYFLQDLKK